MQSLRYLLETSSKFGVPAALVALKELILNRFAQHATYHFYCAPAGAARATDHASDLPCRELSREEALNLACDPDLSIDRQVIEVALNESSRVFAAFDGDLVVGYQFLSTNPRVPHGDIVFHFPDESAYLFRGFVRATHRGRGLIQRLIDAAACAASAKFLYSSVKNTNFKMRGVFGVLRYDDVGTFTLSGTLGQKRDRVRVDRSLRERGVNVEWAD